MPQYVLKDTRSNPSEAEIDGVLLVRGDELNPTELTAEQADRLRSTTGATLVEVEVRPDRFDELKGDALDQAVKDAGIEGASTMTADEKRDALRSAGQTGEEAGS